MQIEELNFVLLPGERISWSGRPKQGLLFTPQDVFLIPFSLLWCGFSIFWESSVLELTGETARTPYHTSAPIFFPLFGGAFVLVGLFMVFGRFVFDAYIRSHSAYAVTDRRILVLRTGAFSNLTALRLDRLPELSLSMARSGLGTIAFGNWGLPFGMRGFAGWIPSLATQPKFLQIDNPKDVFDLIQNRQGAPGDPTSARATS